MTMALRNALKRAASAVPWSVAAPRAMSTAVADRVVLGGASGMPLARRLAPFRANFVGLTHGARSFAAAADCAHPDFSRHFPAFPLSSARAARADTPAWRRRLGEEIFSRRLFVRKNLAFALSAADRNRPLPCVTSAVSSSALTPTESHTTPRQTLRSRRSPCRRSLPR